MKENITLVFAKISLLDFYIEGCVASYGISWVFWLVSDNEQHSVMDTLFSIWKILSSFFC